MTSGDALVTRRVVPPLAPRSSDQSQPIHLDPSVPSARFREDAARNGR